MRSPLPIELAESLRAFLLLCEEYFALAMRENRALSSAADYQPAEFCEKRKRLLPQLEAISAKLRDWRIVWQRMSRSERERCKEVKPLFQSIQSLLMKILLLDRENQQTMLHQGLVPAKHLSSATNRPPHYIARLYQRNAAVQNKSIAQDHVELVDRSPDGQNGFRPYY